MALHPETVKLDLLPEKDKQLIGTTGFPYPQDSTKEFGQETINRAVEIIIHETKHRLKHPQPYFGHGKAMSEGLWR